MDTDYFEVEVNGQQIGVSESRTQEKKIYRIEVGDVKYRIESKVKIERKYWYAYVEGHPRFEDGMTFKSPWSVSFAWRWVREDIAKRIRKNQLNISE